MGRNTQQIGTIRVVCSDPVEATRSVMAFAKDHASGQHVHLANAYTVALADKDRSYREVLLGDAINFPDGKHIATISRLRRDRPLIRQVRGPQLFLDVFDQGRASGIRHFLLGSTEEVLGLLEKRLNELYPGIEIVGTYSPPFRALSEEEFADQDRMISESGAEIVWVGLGTPKQDVECKRMAASIPVTAVAVGAAFDFTAGTLETAPAWMRKAGIEWLHRLSSEPKRLWKRYLFGNTRFLYSAIRHGNGRA